MWWLRYGSYGSSSCWIGSHIAVGKTGAPLRGLSGSAMSPGDTPYNDLHGEAPSERGTFSRPQVYKTRGISQVEVYKRVGKSVI